MQDETGYEERQQRKFEQGVRQVATTAQDTCKGGTAFRIEEKRSSMRGRPAAFWKRKKISARHNRFDMPLDFDDGSAMIDGVTRGASEFLKRPDVQRWQLKKTKIGLFRRSGAPTMTVNGSQESVPIFRDSR